MTTNFKKSLQRVQDALNERGYEDCTVLELADSTRTAQEAADAIGCTLAQIVKSLIFEGVESGNPILVLASGVNRVNEKSPRQTGRRTHPPGAPRLRARAHRFCRRRRAAPRSQRTLAALHR